MGTQRVLTEMAFPNAHCSLLSPPYPSGVLGSQRVPGSIHGPQGDSGGKTNAMHEMRETTEGEEKRGERGAANR